MKQILFVLFFSFAAQSMYAQSQSASKKKNRYVDSLKWSIDVNLLKGNLVQSLSSANFAKKYTNPLNVNQGRLKFLNGSTKGIEGQISYYFGRKKNFGVGTGIIYLEQRGDVLLDAFHIEYQSKDFEGRIFRQEITANKPINESLQITNINIPLLLKYKNRFSKYWGITIQAGTVYNLVLKNAYRTNASFDYEAIYQYVSNADGTKTAVYDNSPIPSVTNDWFITKEQYVRSNLSGMISDFAALNNQGYNVGLGIMPNKKSGNVSYSKISIGFLVCPQLSIYISEKIVTNIGGYFMYQPFKNPISSSYKITDKIGDYSSILNGVSSSINKSCGLNLGVRYAF